MLQKIEYEYQNSCLSPWSGTLAIPGRSRSCPNPWLSGLEWGNDVETPNLEVVRRLSAPLGDKIFLDMGQGRVSMDELLGGRGSNALILLVFGIT